MAFVRSFHRYRGEASFTIARLVAVAREQIPQTVPPQTKYRVTELPTDRTIRFYTANGLVDKPMRGDGGAALYGYRQLLQVLAVKYLQSQYLPLVKIRSLLGGADNRELESMIPAIAPSTAAHRSLVRHDRMVPGSALVPTGRPVADVPAGAALGDGEATSPDLWHRLELGPGIELHLLDAALSGEQRERLRGALLRELAALRGWSGERGEST